MKTGIHAALLLSLVLPGAALGQANPMQRGIDLFRQEKWEAALQQFQSAARQYPKNAVLHNLIGVAETQLGRIQEADASYETSIRLDPKLAAPHKNLGFNFLNAKRYDGAEAELREAIALDGTDPFAHYYLAIAYLENSQDKDAIAHLKPAESLIDNDPNTALLMATACLNGNAPGDALRIIQAVEQHSAFSSDQEYQIATLLNAKGMLDESVYHFRRLAQLRPTSWMAKYDLAVALFDANSPGDALPLLESLATERGGDANILSLLGSAYEASGKPPEALDAYRRAVAADPGNPDRYLDYTRLLMDLDRYDDAVALIQQGIQNTQDSYALNLRLGAVEMMKGQYGEASDCFQKAIAEHPDLAVGYVALAKAYMKEGNDAAAADVLSAARKTMAQDFAIEYVFGLVSSELGHDTEAIEALTRARQMNPAIVEPHYQLGKLYMEAGLWAQAQAELEQVLLLDPAHAQAHYQLSKVYARLGDVKRSREMQTKASELIKTGQDAALSAQRARQSAFHPE
jgi:tetratricopeptide (TPR) repeat protein